jgi:hypothetical protein
MPSLPDLARSPAFHLLACLVAAAAIAHSASAQDEIKATPVKGPWYAQAVAETEGGFLVTHFWSSGASFRSQAIYNGHPIVSIVHGDTYYTLDLLARMGVAIERSKIAIAADAKRGRPFGDELEVLKRSGGEKIGEEEYAGQICDLYRRTDSAGRLQVWATRTNPPLPLRVETYDRRTGRRERVNYVNWLSGYTVPDSFFLPPPDIELERLSYAEFRERSVRENLGPAPPLFSHLLHGAPE